MTASTSLRIDLNTDVMPRLAEAVEQMAAKEQWPPDLSFQIQLALDEIGDNLVEHRDEAQSSHMVVTLVSDAETVTLEIEDDGIEFNPVHDSPPADVTSALEDRPIGGLGLHLIRSLMDKVDYRREDGKNILTLTKFRTS